MGYGGKNKTLNINIQPDASIRQDVDEVTRQLAEKASNTEVIKKAKDDNGGMFPTPFRVPTLGVEEVFPNRRSPYIPVWVSGSTVYAYGFDNTLRKSTDGGKTWAKRGYNAWGFGTYYSFLKTNSGTLLNVSSASPPTIQRSTDDGATWTTVHTYRTNTVPLGSQSWCIDPTTGHIYMGEYNTSPTNEIRLWRSTDDGVTWNTLFSFPGELTPTGTDKRIRHIHSVQWDHVANRVVISTGDSTPDTGLWRTNATADGVEKIVTNSMLPAEDIDAPRSIGIMPFTDYIAWAGDTTQNPYLYRIARSEIGKANPVIERIYRLNSAAWFTCKASDDGSRWVLSASEEGNSLDNLVHLYAVDDQGLNVWEIGAIPSPLTSPAAALQPIGVPEQGETFHMVSRAFGLNVAAWKFRLGKGTVSLPRPEPLPDVLVQQTAATGVITLAPLEERIFFVSVAGGFARKLNILDAGVGLISGIAGNISVSVRKKGETATVYSSTNNSDRYTTRQDMSTVIGSSLFTGGDMVEFVVKNLHAGTTMTCAPFVIFGWGLS